MIAFHVEKSQYHPGHHVITIDPRTYTEINQYTAISTSYHLLESALFGLTYTEYLRMCRDEYHGTLHGGAGYITVSFKDIRDANALRFDLYKRWNILTDGWEIKKKEE